MFDRLEIVHIVLVGMDMLGILELITKSWLGLLYFLTFCNCSHSSCCDGYIIFGHSKIIVQIILARLVICLDII